MDVVIGVNPDEAGRDAVALGVCLARTFADDPVLAYVHLPTIDYPSMGNVDAEWERYVADQSAAILAEAAEAAAEYGAGDVRVMQHGNRSSGTGLSEVADTLDTRVVVIGSAPGGSTGRITPGSTADKLLHGSPYPVALAPHGYRRVAPDRVGRVVVAYQRTSESDRALATAATLARAFGVPLLVVTVVLRMTRVFGTNLSGDPEQPVIDALVESAEADQAHALGALTDLDASGAVVVGGQASGALSRIDWRDDDLLVLGSAAAGPLRRVFLGDMTYKLLRAAPVPALVLPRHG